MGEPCNYGLSLTQKNVILLPVRIGFGKEGSQLFVIDDMTDAVRLMQPKVEEILGNLVGCISNDAEPSMCLGKQCFSPYDCGFWKYCSANLPSPNVFDIAGMQLKKKCACYDDGLISFEDLLKKGSLNKAQKLQVKYELENPADHIEVDKIRAFLDTLKYPLYFLDFESFQPAIPIYENSKP